MLLCMAQRPCLEAERVSSTNNSCSYAAIMVYLVAAIRLVTFLAVVSKEEKEASFQEINNLI